ncbi:GNAT family N-acetyltransferase [Streptomyces sp. MK5]|uniref:GNAT family N-acetyltransferase n=1 Tax=Streptomyces sp. MK5 TaxID=3064253 RepID=UPI002741227E|nr:GNAT family N-acetyltransferase [Streptomyces sp. MK5]
MSPADAGAATDQASATTGAPDRDPEPIPMAAAAVAVPGAIGTDLRPGPAEAGTDSEDTLDLHLPDDFVALFAGRSAPGSAADDLLDGVGDWGVTATPVGTFQLVPVQVERDLPVIGRWMNDPAVAEYWQLAGPQSVTEAHLRAQLDGDGRSVPCLGLLQGTPISYWEIYRADLDPLAHHYPARPHDTGVHLLIGSVTDRGRGLGSALLRAVADLILDKRLSCSRVVAEPDLRNAPSVAAFLTAGFRFAAEVDLPDKQAALMIRDRSLRELL